MLIKKTVIEYVRYDKEGEIIERKGKSRKKGIWIKFVFYFFSNISM